LELAADPHWTLSAVEQFVQRGELADSRITNDVDVMPPFAVEEVQLLPSAESRRVDMFRGSLFG
jgi:hypothetical protein